MTQQLYRTLTGQSQKSQQDGSAPMDTSQPALSRMTTTNTQTGALNHLTDKQELKLEEFKEKLQRDGWWSPDGTNGKPTHDKGTLLRFLRARKFDVQGAYVQFTNTEKWMKEQYVEDLYEHFDVDFYERARTMYPQWTGHRDRRGIPIYVYEIKGLDSKAVDKYQKESAAYKANSPNHKNLSTSAKMLPLFALYHNLLNFVLPLCSSLEREQPEVPVTNSTNIVDIQGVSLRQFWNLKTHMQDASVLATAHYPETLDRIFIIGAPSFFPTVWGWIKRWFDPVTVSKIFILGRNEVQPTLEQFMEPTSIPKKYGGQLDWRWGDMPDLDTETREALERDGNRGWVKGPALWLDNKRMVVGSNHGKLSRSDKEIAEKKPIIYAADYTEVPVHPEKRASTVSGHKRSQSIPNGTTTPTERDEHPSACDPKSPSTLVEGELRQPSSAAVAVAASAATTVPVVEAARDEPATSKQQPLNVPIESVRNSPMGDSQVHIPNAQPAAPAQTVEYLSGTTSNDSIAAAPSSALAPAPSSESALAPGSSMPQTTGTAIAAATAEEVVSAAPHPPSRPSPEPLSNHAVKVNRMIADKLQKESTVILPAQQNGALPHPEMVIASDLSKGLAMEVEKLHLGNGGSIGNEGPARPQPERFVTAMEVPH